MLLAQSLELATVSRRLVVDMVFANLLALFMIAILLGGCSMQPSAGDRPDWSLTEPDIRAQSTTTANGKHYGDWNGPGAPQPLRY